MNDPEPPRDEIVRSNALLAGLVVTSALLVTLSGPPFGWWPLAFIALVPLFVVLHGRVASRAAGVAWLTGLLTSFLGLFWLPSTLEGFSELSPSAAIGFTFVLNGYQAGRWALLGWLYVRLTRSSWPVAAAALFASVTAEVVYPLPFPWYFGSALHEAPVLLQVVELGGPTSASLVAVSVSAAVLPALRFCSSTDKRRSVYARLRFLEGRERHALLAAGALAPLALLYGLVRMQHVDSDAARAPSLIVGVVQPDLPPAGTNLRDALELQLALSRSLVSEGPVDLLLWSETALPGAPPQFAARQHFEGLVTRHTGVPTLFGSAIALSGPQLNSAFLSDKRGNICAHCRYDKQILLPFGETLPGERWLPTLRQSFPRSGRFVPGPRRHGMALDGRNVGVTICYEELHSGYVRKQVSDGAAQLLVNLTDDSWFAAPEASQWHFTLAKLRAVEQRRFLVRATNSGVSAVVDPVGRVVAHAPPGTASMLQEVRWLDERTVYSYVGDAPWWFVGIATIIVAILPAKWLRSGHRGPTNA